MASDYFGRTSVSHGNTDASGETGEAEIDLPGSKAGFAAWKSVSE